MDMKSIGSIYYENYVSINFIWTLNLMFALLNNYFCIRPILAWCLIKGPQQINRAFQFTNLVQPIINSSCICSSHLYPSHVSSYKLEVSNRFTTLWNFHQQIFTNSKIFNFRGNKSVGKKGMRMSEAVCDEVVSHACSLTEWLSEISVAIKNININNLK